MFNRLFKKSKIKPPEIMRSVRYCVNCHVQLGPEDGLRYCWNYIRSGGNNCLVDPRKIQNRSASQ